MCGCGCGCVVWACVESEREQELDFAKKTAEDSQAREQDLRRLLETAKKDAEAEVKAQQEKFEMEAKTVSFDEPRRWVTYGRRPVRGTWARGAGVA